jgi:hypothetical protein
MPKIEASRSGWHGAPRKDRRKRLSVSKTLGAPGNWAPTEEDWSRLQTAYGETFGSSLRAEIEIAVQEYFYWAPFEEAPFANKYILMLSRTKALAKELGKAVHSLADAGAGPMVARHWGRYFPNLDAERINDPADEDDNAFFHRIVATPSKRSRDHRDFSQVVHTLHSALDAALRDVKSKSLPAFSDGDAWNQLVVDLARAFRGARLKVTASKDANLPLSPFVRFVTELQGTFKDEKLRRHPTPAGLSLAVSGAINKLKPKRRHTTITIA